MTPEAPAPDPGSCGRPYLRAFLTDVMWSLLIGAALTILLVPVQGYGWPRSALAFVVNSTITFGIGLSLANLYRLAFPYLSARWPGRFRELLIHAVLLTSGVLFGAEVAIRLLQLTLGLQPGGMRGNVLRIGLVVAVICVALSLAFERLKRRAREVELRGQESRQRELRARLEALQARTNPHFLFNSLNTVAALVEEDPASAERALEKLSGLYRYTLDGSASRWVKLEQELRAVKDYLEMETLRFGERLRWSIESSEGADASLVPPLLVQPLVENAVLHAVAPRKAGGTVQIRAVRGEGGLELQVEDDGPGPGGSGYRGAGTALETLRDRLRLLYEGAASLETTAASAGGFLATVRIPSAGGEVRP